MSDDEEDEYNTIAQAASSRGVKLLFSKSKVRYCLPSIETDLTEYTGLRPSNILLQR